MDARTRLPLPTRRAVRGDAAALLIAACASSLPALAAEPAASAPDLRWRPVAPSWAEAARRELAAPSDGRERAGAPSRATPAYGTGYEARTAPRGGGNPNPIPTPAAAAADRAGATGGARGRR